MSDLMMLGYTVTHFETSLHPEVVHFTGESEKGLAVKCDAYIPSDSKHSVLRIQLSIGGYLPDGKPIEERTPIVVAEGEFLFNFESSDKLDDPTMEASVKSTGLQAAIPVLRGILVGVGNILNLPPVFSFPSFGPDDIEWETDEAEE